MLALRRSFGVLAIGFVGLVVGTELVRRPADIRLVAAGCIGLSAIVAAMEWPALAVAVTLALLPYLAVGRRLLLKFTP